LDRLADLLELFEQLVDVGTDAVEGGEDRHDVGLEVLGELRQLVDQPDRGVHLVLGELLHEPLRERGGLARDRLVDGEQLGGALRMAKSDLRVRPIFHHHKEAIEAHLTVVFAALAISRHLQEQTGGEQVCP
jgi:hypothetical protein